MENSRSKVHFFPVDVTVEIEKGKTILDAAYKGDLFINALCGGDGTCGKCKVILGSGMIESMLQRMCQYQRRKRDMSLHAVRR